MQNPNYELRVGLFALFALIMLLGGWGWLKSFSPFDPPIHFWVKFHDVAGLSNNATVNIQGVRVGVVDRIQFSAPEGISEPADTSPEDAYKPRVYARVKITATKMPIPKNSTITIQTLGLVGAKYIEITLPEIRSQSSETLDPNIIINGQDPVRVELVLNNFAHKFNAVVNQISSEKGSRAIKDYAEAGNKLNKNMDKLSILADDLKTTTLSVNSTAIRFGKAADSSDNAFSNASGFFSRGRQTMTSVDDLAITMKGTSSKLNKLLDNPNFSSDLKETMNLAHKTAETVASVMADLRGTVQDKDLRQDLITMLTKIETSTQDIKQSMQTVDRLASDGELRSDIKSAVQNAREAMDKANHLLDDPNFKADLTQTMHKVRTAAAEVDTAAQQVRQILGRRAPLLQMMFGRPGKIKVIESETNENSDNKR